MNYDYKQAEKNIADESIEQRIAALEQAVHSAFALIEERRAKQRAVNVAVEECLDLFATGEDMATLREALK